MPRPKPAKERPIQVAVICNLTEQSYAEQRTYGVIPILPVIEGIQYIGRCAASMKRLEEELDELEFLDAPGMPKQILGRCKPGEEFALTEVMDARAARYETGEKIAHDRIEAYDIADDVVGNVNKTLVINMAGNAASPFAGIFVCNGDGPTAEELKKNREKLRICDEARVATADNSWSTYKNHIFCIDALPAAKRLNIEDREWMGVYKPTKDCPICFTKLDPRAIVCRQCNFVLDEQMAIKKGFLRPEPEAKPQKPA